jgi:hypothetical protein
MSMPATPSSTSARLSTEWIVYQPDDSFNIVGLLLVTDLEVRPRAQKNGEPAGGANGGE